ncbi:MAG TPA: hypothetical protein VGE59_01260 [Patescibacteria group bacterium]
MESVLRLVIALLAVITTLVLSAFAEWAGHAVMHHKGINRLINLWLPWLPNRHLLEHHGDYMGEAFSHDPPSKYKLSLSVIGVTAIEIALLLILQPILGSLVTKVVIVVSVGYLTCYEGVHYLLHNHCPRLGRLYATDLFHSMEKHHRGHHHRAGVNFGILPSGRKFDEWFGTIGLENTTPEPPHPST